MWLSYSASTYALALCLSSLMSVVLQTLAKTISFGLIMKNKFSSYNDSEKKIVIPNYN